LPRRPRGPTIGAAPQCEAGADKEGAAAAQPRSSLRNSSAAGAAVFLLLAPTLAHATPIERNLPPAPAAPQTQIAPPVAPLASDDATPLGPSLHAIVLLGAKDDLKANEAGGVDTSSVARANDDELRDTLAPYIGQPISKKLVGEIAADIVKFYRAKGFPFVSVTTPPQEITQGVVQFRVVEFVLGSVKVKGNASTPSAYIVDGLRVKSGQPIDADSLEQDLDWLNRYPFRELDASFSPGETLGETDLTLAATEVDPWRVYAGWSNSGTRATSEDRINLGATIGSLLFQDSLLSYQFTTSPDFWYGRDVFGDAGHPRYLTHAVSYATPVAPRQSLELDFDMVQSFTPATTASPFDVGQRTYEVTLSYRSALSNFVDLPGDVRAGLEAKREERSTFFGGAKAADAGIEVYQLFTGWNDDFTSILGHSSIDLAAHYSPGGLDTANDATAFSNFTSGSVKGARYVYGSLNFSNAAELPFDLAASTQVLAQFASSALPDTEQLGLGGMSLVRGYTLDDGAFDNTIIARNELHIAPFSPLGDLGIDSDRLSPFAFVDYGYGDNHGTHKSARAGSIGLGTDYAVEMINASVTGAYDFEKAPVTKSGTFRIDARVSVAF
jgi:hemolysin activation/secretion protein